MNILSLFVIIPLVMMAILFCIPGEKKSLIRTVMAIGGLALLAVSAYLTVDYLSLRAGGDTQEFLYAASTTWYETLNIQYSVGVDGVSVAMLLLSSIVVITGVFVSYAIEEKVKEYFLWFLMLSIGVYGFFISLDLFTMFLFYEVALIPMYLLIGLWGSGRKEYSAMKLTLMLMGGSAFLMVGILGIYYYSAPEGSILTFNIQEIAKNVQASMAAGGDQNWQYIFFPLTFIGFGVLGAMFPFHTWSPDGHASAPTAVSMLHAGVLMKLGGYGCFRVAMYLMPQAANDLAWIFIILTGISVVYGAFSACVQNDLKYINAYSSVSHCGLVLFALLMMNKTAMTGAILQMVSHGLMTALFFALIGMIYGRTHTRDIREMGGLMQIMPRVAEQFNVPQEEAFDPETNIRLASKLLNKIDRSLRLSSSATEEDRLCLMLASYVCGIGHVRDAQRLAAKHDEDPEKWEVVSRYLELKGQPEYYQDPVVRCGRFTGIKQTLAYVRNVKSHYNKYCELAAL